MYDAGQAWRSVQLSHFTEGETEARVWDGNKSEVGPEVDGKARPEYMSKARPFHDAPVPLAQGSGYGGVPMAYPCHHLSPRAPAVGWDTGSGLLPGTGPGTTESLLLKVHVMKRNKDDPRPIEPSVSEAQFPPPPLPRTDPVS